MAFLFCGNTFCHSRSQKLVMEFLFQNFWIPVLKSPKAIPPTPAARQYHPISVCAYWHSSKDTHSHFSWIWHLQASFSRTWNFQVISTILLIWFFSPQHTRYLFPFVPIFFSREIWGKCFEWFSWFCFVFLPLPVISGDETLQQCSRQNLCLNLTIFEDFVESHFWGWRQENEKRIVKFMSFDAGHKFLPCG